MRKTKLTGGSRCPNCGNEENQAKYGFNRSGTQRCRCGNCSRTYTLEPKNRAYPDEIRKNAINAYYSGASGREVGKMFGMSKENVFNWLKKTDNNK